jgi:hypothetical protein
MENLTDAMKSDIRYAVNKAGEGKASNTARVVL